MEPALSPSHTRRLYAMVNGCFSIATAQCTQEILADIIVYKASTVISMSSAEIMNVVFSVLVFQTVIYTRQDKK